MMKMQIEQKSVAFESKNLWKAVDPNKQADGSWRIKTNEQLDRLMKGKNILW
jgi:hypothetical protein